MNEHLVKIKNPTKPQYDSSSHRKSYSNSNQRCCELYIVREKKKSTNRRKYVLILDKPKIIGVANEQ